MSRIRILPDDFIQLEYIKTTGTQYIDLGFQPHNNTRVIVDITIADGAMNAVPFGARASATSNNYAIMRPGGTSTIRSDYNTTYTQTWDVDPTVRRIIDKNKNVTIIDGVSQSYTNSSFTVPVNLTLFALNNNGTVQWYSSSEFYSGFVYDNSICIRDLVPCRQKSTNILGLYDLINSHFYTNDGTGEFIAGPAVSLKKGNTIEVPCIYKAQEIILPRGTYQLECWGAQGGNYTASVIGGPGGYSKGILTLANNHKLFLYAGGAGQYSTTAAGGFNGGGKGYPYSSSASGGGGASDIRIDEDSLYARVIVAGGGGGAMYYNGGYGGGLKGEAAGGQGEIQTGSNRSGGGGTQTDGGIAWSQSAWKGTFGKAYDHPGTGYENGGGGGGWYGGAPGYDNDSDNDGRGGGGGSGYVYTAETVSNYPSGCLLNSSYYLTGTSLLGGNISFANYDGTIQTGQRGDGGIRITILDIAENYYVKINNTTWARVENIYFKVNDNLWLTKG